MDNISIVFDKRTGYTKGIYDPQDDFAMNWVLENSDWGSVDGFSVQNVNESEKGIVV